MSAKVIRTVGTMLVIPAVTGLLVGRFADSWPKPYGQILLGVLAVAFIVWAFGSLRSLNRDRDKGNAFLVRQNEMLLGTLLGQEGPDEAMTARLKAMTVPDLIDLQAKMMLSRHVLEELKVLAMDHEDRERFQRALRETYVQLVDQLTSTEAERARLIQQAPDWEIWATV